MFFFLLFCVAFSLTRDQLLAPALKQSMIDYINSLNTTWVAGPNPHFTDKTLEHAKKSCGTFLRGGPTLPEAVITPSNGIPESFDPRDEWGEMCPILKDVRDQGPCGSCWGISAVEVMSDRFCLASKGKVNAYLSTQDVVSCCDSCSMFGGCNGGWPSAAFSYWNSQGVVTGGKYKSNEGCYPYELMECEHHINGTKPPCPPTQDTPACKKKCINGLDWASDKHYGVRGYSVRGIENIQTELMTNGPTTVAFTVYEDFLTYRSGVYKHHTGSALGGHAVKLIGWGVQKGVDVDTPYWLVVNSWNEDWGDHGLFKILRGSNECGIEGQVYTGLPKL